jgi:DNA-binding XRE family transcriptional regulator
MLPTIHGREHERTPKKNHLPRTGGGQVATTGIFEMFEQVLVHKQTSKQGCRESPGRRKLSADGRWLRPRQKILPRFSNEFSVENSVRLGRNNQGRRKNVGEHTVLRGASRSGVSSYRRRNEETAEPDIRERFGYVRLRREEIGLTQEDLADRANIHRTYLSDLERGTRNVSLFNTDQLAAALELLALFKRMEKH